MPAIIVPGIGVVSLLIIIVIVLLLRRSKKQEKPNTGGNFLILISNDISLMEHKISNLCIIFLFPQSILIHVLCHSDGDGGNEYDVAYSVEAHTNEKQQSEEVYGSIEEDPYFQVQNPYYGGEVEMGGMSQNPDFKNVEVVTATQNLYYE